MPSEEEAGAWTGILRLAGGVVFIFARGRKGEYKYRNHDRTGGHKPANLPHQITRPEGGVFEAAHRWHFKSALYDRRREGGFASN